MNDGFPPDDADEAIKRIWVRKAEERRRARFCGDPVPQAFQEHRRTPPSMSMRIPSIECLIAEQLFHYSALTKFIKESKT